MLYNIQYITNQTPYQRHKNNQNKNSHLEQFVKTIAILQNKVNKISKSNAFFKIKISRRPKVERLEIIQELFLRKMK